MNEHRPSAPALSKSGRRIGRPPRLPWRDLKPGDHLFIAKADLPRSGEASLRGSCYRWGRELGGRIRVRKLEADYRVERTA